MYFSDIMQLELKTAFQKSTLKVHVSAFLVKMLKSI